MQKQYPSVKSILRIKGTTPESAALAKRIMEANKRETLERLPVYDTYYQKTGFSMYNPHNLPELKMQLLDIVLNGYGMEGFKVINHGYCDYINFGDTYDTTIIYFKNRFSVGCWGDIAERYETE